MYFDTEVDAKTTIEREHRVDLQAGSQTISQRAEALKLNMLLEKSAHEIDSCVVFISSVLGSKYSYFELLSIEYPKMNLNLERLKI